MKKPDTLSKNFLFHSLFLLVFILMSSGLWAKDPEATIIEIEKSLMAPCCWSGTVYDHGHGEMEKEIRDFVDEGRSKAEIIEYYKGIYGERILAVPVASGFNLFAWLGPVIFSIIGITIIVLFIRTPKRKQPETVKKSSSESDIPYNNLIEKELTEMD